MLSQTICDHVPSSQLSSSISAAGKMQSILWILGSELYHYYKDSSSETLSAFTFVRSSSSSLSCNTKKRQGIRMNEQVIKSSGQICRHWGTVHIFFLFSESGGQYLLPEKHRGSTVHFKATAANGEGIFVSALAKKQTPETWHFTWITGFLQYRTGRWGWKEFQDSIPTDYCIVK